VTASAQESMLSSPQVKVKVRCV